MNSFIKGKRILVSAIFLSVPGILLQSCKKEDSALGLGLQPEGDLLNATLVDSFAIETYTALEDSLRTDELSNCLLGSYVDPVFGKTTASFYTQLGLATPNPTLGAFTIDSVHIRLRYASPSHYGALDPQTFSVQRITQQFYKDSDYYSSSELTTSGVELMLPGFETITPKTTGNTVLGNDTLDPMLVLRLNPSIGTDILNGVAGGNLASETAFNNFFYGLRIAVNNPAQAVNSGGILYFNLTDSDTRMVIYYTEGTTQKQMAFPISTNQARFSHFEHDYTGTPVADQLANPSQGQKFFYTQSMAGVHSIINIPGIDGLKKLGGNIIIHKAELSLPVQYFITAPYTPAAANFIVYKKTDGEYASTYDQLAQYSIYGGLYNDSQKAVVFNIGRHVQRMVKGEIENLGFKVLNGASSVAASRNVYAGQDSPNREKPYLKVYYTKY